MRALYAALRRAIPGASHKSYCKVGGTGPQDMKRKIMGKDRPLARAWELIFTTLDDYSRSNADLDLEWIPAHTAKGATGFARLTDGRKLTENDRNSKYIPHEIA